MKPHQIASAKFHAKRKDAGWKKVTVWLDADSLTKLDTIRTQEGSLDKAIAYAVRMSPTREVIEKSPRWIGLAGAFDDIKEFMEK